MAYLQIRCRNPTGHWEDSICGGSIIDEQWILTAAHCFSKPDEMTYTKIKITLGEYLTKENEGTEVHAQADEVVIHKDFENQNYDNDVALVKLNITLNFKGKHRHLTPVCLPSAKSAPTGKCQVSGWGNHVAGKEDQAEFSKVLREVPVKIQDQAKCLKAWGDYDKQKHICAGDGRHDFCSGDSGGPLTCFANNVYTIHGLVSYGALDSCGSDNPGVYTRLVNYLTWIKKVLNE